MSALPKAVQKQVEEANKLAEQLNQQRIDNVQPPPDSPAQEPAETTSEQSSPPEASEGWEQRYKVLQGKYNAEVPRLQRTVNDQTSTISDLKQQLTSLQMMVASLNQNRNAAPVEQASAPASSLKLVKDEEVREYGEDLTDFIRRVAQESVLPKVEQQIQPMKQQVEQVKSATSQVMTKSAKSDHERLLATLDSQVEGWRQQNEDPQFLDWLDNADPYSGVTRGQLLKQAYDRYDAPRVVAFFNGYRNEHAVVTPPTSVAAQQAAPQRKLDDFVAPGAAKPASGATDAQDGAGKRIWTQAEIKRFYDDCTAGKYRTNQERRKQIELDIVAAAREGRVR